MTESTKTPEQELHRQKMQAQKEKGGRTYRRGRYRARRSVLCSEWTDVLADGRI
jgi:hypothetical protein